MEKGFKSIKVKSIILLFNEFIFDLISNLGLIFHKTININLTLISTNEKRIIFF